VFVIDSDGGKWELEIIEMSLEEYENLPDFEGF